MALQAGSSAPATVTASPPPKSSLDIAFFWEKVSLLPPVPMDQWKDSFTIALYAKTNIDVEEIRYYSPKPELAPEPTPPGVETNAQQATRLGRDAAARKDVEDRHAIALKEWKEASASGLNLAAANQKGKSLLYIMLGHEETVQATSTTFWFVESRTYILVTFGDISTTYSS